MQSVTSEMTTLSCSALRRKKRRERSLRQANEDNATASSRPTSKVVLALLSPSASCMGLAKRTAERNAGEIAKRSSAASSSWRPNENIPTAPIAAMVPKKTCVVS